MWGDSSINIISSTEQTEGVKTSFILFCVYRLTLTN